MDGREQAIMEGIANILMDKAEQAHLMPDYGRTHEDWVRGALRAFQQLVDKAL